MQKNASLLLVLGVIAVAAWPVGGTPAQTNDSQPAVRQRRRLALLVGVGNYHQFHPRPGWQPWPKLHTDREIEQYRQVLVNNRGFAERDVVTLLNEKATKQEIRRIFYEHLVAQARPGDVALFHFSGHGQQLPDDEDPALRDEADGLDESLVTYDALDQSPAEGAQKNIRDDEFGQWLEALAKAMRPAADARVDGNITVTLDTCFSGSATRGAGATPRGRAWDPAIDGPLPPTRPDLRPEASLGLLDAAGPSSVQRDIIAVTASRANESAWERGDEGVFTRHWVRLLARDKLEAPLTYQAAADSLTFDLAAEGLEQTPQVVGAGERLLFSGLARPDSRPRAALLARRTSDNELWLSAGSIFGVTRGSHYKLYAADSLTFDATSQLGEAVADEVQPFAARLHPLAARITGYHGVLAVESLHAYALQPLRVALLGADAVPKLRAALCKLNIISVREKKKSAGKPDADYDLVLRYEPSRRSVAIERPGNRVPWARIPLSAQATTLLEEKLRAEWRRLHFATLKNDNPEARVEIDLMPAYANLNQRNEFIDDPKYLDSPPPATHLRLARYKSIGLRLRNRSARDLYVAVLAIFENGEISVLFQNALAENRIPANDTIIPPLKQVLRVLVGPPGERILMKVIATDTFVDFSGVEYIGHPETRRIELPPATSLPAYKPLQRLFEGLADETRGAFGLVQPAHWGTTDASVVIE